MDIMYTDIGDEARLDFSTPGEEVGDITVENSGVSAVHASDSSYDELANDAILDEFDNLEKLTLEHSKLIDAEIAVTMSDNPAYIMEKLFAVGGNEETVTVENAVVNKTQFGEIVKRLIRKNKAAREESTGAISALWKKMSGNRLGPIEKLKESIVSGKLVPKSSVSASDAKSVNNKLGYFSNIGKDVNKVDDIISHLNEPKRIADTILKENVAFANAEIANGWGNFTAQFNESKSVKAPMSVAFLKSLKSVEYKDVDLLIGYPIKLFSKHLSFTVVYAEKKKEKDVVNGVEVSTETVETPTQDVKPLSKDEAIKVLDTALHIVKTSDTTIKNIDKIVGELSEYKFNGKVISSLAVESPTTMLPHINDTSRYFLPLVTTIKNLYLDYYEVNKYARLRVSVGMEKA